MKTVQIDGARLQDKMNEYGDMLFKLSYLRLRNIQDAEDVVQETFFQYLRHEEAFESSEHERAWLLKVALNLCRKLWGSAWRRHRSDGEWTEECGEKPLHPEDAREPERAALEKEAGSSLMRAVMALPARYRDVIHLFYYEELSVKEIAQVTGRRESTVTSQLTRGRDMLKKALKEDYDFGEIR